MEMDATTQPFATWRLYVGLTFLGLWFLQSGIVCSPWHFLNFQCMIHFCHF